MYCDRDGLSSPSGNCDAGHYCILGAIVPNPVSLLYMCLWHMYSCTQYFRAINCCDCYIREYYKSKCYELDPVTCMTWSPSDLDTYLPNPLMLIVAQLNSTALTQVHSYIWNIKFCEITHV